MNTQNLILYCRGVEILKCSTCPRASYLKNVTCSDKILLVLFFVIHKILFCIVETPAKRRSEAELLRQEADMPIEDLVAQYETGESIQPRTRILQLLTVSC
jgi:hypothetical protein